MHGLRVKTMNWRLGLSDTEHDPERENWRCPPFLPSFPHTFTFRVLVARVSLKDCGMLSIFRSTQPPIVYFTLPA